MLCYGSEIRGFRYFEKIENVQNKNQVMFIDNLIDALLSNIFLKWSLV